MLVTRLLVGRRQTHIIFVKWHNAYIASEFNKFSCIETCTATRQPGHVMGSNSTQLAIPWRILLSYLLTLQLESCRTWVLQHSISFNACWCDSVFTCLKLGEDSKRCYWSNWSCDESSWRKMDKVWFKIVHKSLHIIINFGTLSISF